MVDEHDIVEVGVRGGNDASVVGYVCSGAVIDSDCSGYHGSGVGVADGSANSVGSVSSGDSLGATSALLFGGMRASVFCPVDQHSEEEGKNVGDVCRRDACDIYSEPSYLREVGCIARRIEFRDVHKGSLLSWV